MRLHHLSVSAFGPFSGTEHVDFEELNAAGLFLLTGATGAGKTSLLDAVCFALYGTVPGVREVRSLRSQHAPSEAVPEVVLDFTVRNRRFVVRRRPEWLRLKRRGTGTTTEKAYASITETTDGSDRFLTARAAEVGILVRDLMGMSAGQFTQVALLPQGEFQTFLRASSQDRHDVLQQLFRTDRFARIEEWVGEHSRRLREEAQGGRDAVQRLLDTVADRAGTSAPGALDGEGLAVAAARGDVLRWVSQVRDAAGSAASAAAADHAGATRALTHATSRLEAETRRAELRARRDAAREVLDQLQGSGSRAAEAQENLESHSRAVRCLPVVEEHSRAADDVAGAEQDLRDAVDALRRAPLPFWAGVADLSPAEVLAWLTAATHRPADAGGAPAGGSAGTDLSGTDLSGVTHSGVDLSGLDLSGVDLSGVVEAARDQVARWLALVPRERAAADARRARDRDLRLLEGAQRELAVADGRCQRLPGEVADLEAELAEAVRRAVRRPTLEAELTAATLRHQAAAALPPAQQRLHELEDAQRDARDRAQDAREELQSLVARRLAGMAAELAGALADGAACQVCGSTEHPDKARAAHDAVTDDDHAAADGRFCAADAVLERTREAVQEQRRAHDALVIASAGLGSARAAEDVAAHTAALADAVAAGQQQEALEGRLRDLRLEQVAVAERQSAAAGDVARLRESVVAHQRTIDQVATELASALGMRARDDERGDQERSDEGRGDEERGLQPSPASASTALAGWADLLVVARDSAAELERARQRLVAVSARCVATLAGHGFVELTEVGTALLTDEERGRLAGWLRERDESTVRARAVLDDPDVAALDQSEPEETDLALFGQDLTVPDLFHQDVTAPARPDPEDPESLLDALRAACTEAEDQSRSTAALATLERDRATALDLLRDRVADAVASWAPLRDTSLRAEGIARLVKGRGHDNQLQMRLSAYVLATRLDQVVAAANERLAHMRDQRYVLQRTDRAERRGTQAGLGIEVVDQWTGESRAPSTLSGGETFVVSLALALGLADVVTHEAGGTDVETLFVDEGFGTLDADTLDDVMDRLDALRAGGRTVGVVSHVTELRDRIPVQVQVDKGRNGSTVQVRTLTAAG